MMINLKLEGFIEEIVNELVHKRIASNKTEAIRMALLHYNEHFDIKKMNQYLEDQAAIKKIYDMQAEIKTGKKKLLSKEDVLSKYPQLRDV